MRVKYIAYDGKVFDDAKECKKYEDDRIQWKVRDLVQDINKYKSFVLPHAHREYMVAKTWDMSCYSPRCGFSMLERRLMIAERKLRALNNLKEKQEKYRMMREELREFHRQLRSLQK